MGGDGRRVRVERGDKRVRAMLAGLVVADTTAVRLVWERPHFPTYYIPGADVDAAALVDPGEVGQVDGVGAARVMSVEAGGRRAAGAARVVVDPAVDELVDTVRLSWRSMDAWFEEDEQVHVHPRDPYTRVEVLHSSRHVRVEVDEVPLADSHQPRLLFETGLPVRLYLPKVDVRTDLLTPTGTTTRCPYKGVAQHYAVHADDRVHHDLAWWYQHPAPEAVKVAGCVCFYDERVDTFVDGVRRQRPDTPFTRPGPHQ